MKQYIAFDEKSFSPLSPVCVREEHCQKVMKEKPATYSITMCSPRIGEIF